MGLNVGDVIIARDDHADDKWSKLKLTLLCIGKKSSFFSEEIRSHQSPEWRYVRESGNWLLNQRDWFKVAL